MLSNGLCISPLKQTPETRSLRESVLAIDNEKDLNDYLSSQHSKMPPRTGPPKYERNQVSSRTSSEQLSRPPLTFPAPRLRESNHDSDLIGWW